MLKNLSQLSAGLFGIKKNMNLKKLKWTNLCHK